MPAVGILFDDVPVLGPEGLQLVLPMLLKFKHRHRTIIPTVDCSRPQLNMVCIAELIKMCLNETYSKIRVDKYLCDSHS